jgi:hypothetical protein
MQDATFLRLKSVEVGYTLPRDLLKKIKVQNFRVYVSGTNLLCWSKFKLWDPETALDIRFSVFLMSALT